MNNLIIIGNGFDMAHNLETGYTYFIKYVVNSHINKKKEFPELFEIVGNLQSYDELIAQFNPSIIHRTLRFKNKFFGLLISNHILNNWSDIESLYFSELIKIKDKKSSWKTPKELNDEFKEVKDSLEIYLSLDEIQNPTLNDSFIHFLKKMNNEDAVILNFNYTDTSAKYLEGSYHKTIKIHGELKSPNNPIIFGYAADDKLSRELINTGDFHFMTNIKKHNYKRTENENVLSDYLDFTKEIEVSILGHSCGLSDNLILNQIFNHENIKSIRIFYYKDHDRFFQAQVNIDRIMDSDDNFKKLISFQESCKIPQFDDSDEIRSEFKAYIDIVSENQRRSKDRSLYKDRII